MESKIRVGVFSPNDPRPWVREENIDLMLAHESSLINALEGQGVEVVRGGDGLPKMDQIAWNTRLVWEHIKKDSGREAGYANNKSRLLGLPLRLSRRR